MKSHKKDKLEILIENYFQCIYYLVTTDYGDGQNLSRSNIVIPEDIKVDEQDMLFIYSNIGVFNLHLIQSKNSDFLSKCVREIVDIINSPNIVIPIKEINTKLQQRLFEAW